MYQIKDKIKLIDTFNLTNNDEVIICSKNHIEFLSDKISIKVRNSNEPICIFIVSNVTGIFTFHSDGKCYLNSNMTNTFIEVPYKSQDWDIWNNYLIVYTDYDYDKLLPVYNLFDMHNECLIFQKGICGNLKWKDELLFNINKSISLISQETGEAIWIYNPTIENRNTEVVQVLGVINNVVFIDISPCNLIAINIEDGNQLWVAESFTEVLKLEDYFVFGESMSSRTPLCWHFDADSNKILLLSRHFYISFNIKTQEWELKHSFLETIEEWDINYSVYKNGFIYFTGSTSGSLPNCVGIFDVNECKVIWQFEIEHGYFEKNIQASNDRLCVLDTNNTLHIFEKE